MSLQSEILRKSIIGILSITGMGAVSIAGWTVNKILEHERMLPLMAQDIGYIKEMVKEIKFSVNNK